MSPLGESGQPDEDEWWRQLYGGPPPGPDDGTGSGAADSLDEHFATALDASAGTGPARAAVEPEEVPTPDTVRLRRPPTPAAVPELPPGWAPVSRAPAPAPVSSWFDRPGERAPAYEAETAEWPPADPDRLDDPRPDTLLDGARYRRFTLRVTATRGDAARYRGRPRSEALLTARFGTGDDALLFVALARGEAAEDACRVMGGAVGRSFPRLTGDIRAADRGALKSGLQRLTDRAYGTLRGRTADPEGPALSVRCLLLPVDPGCRLRVVFGTGAGGLFRLRDGGWQDLDPERAEPGFRFRASDARPGDVLLMCGAGFAEPMLRVPELSARLAERWAPPCTPPGLPGFLADVTTRARGFGDDRGAVGVWEDPF